MLAEGDVDLVAGAELDELYLIEKVDEKGEEGGAGEAEGEGGRDRGNTCAG